MSEVVEVLAHYNLEAFTCYGHKQNNVFMILQLKKQQTLLQLTVGEVCRCSDAISQVRGGDRASSEGN